MKSILKPGAVLLAVLVLMSGITACGTSTTDNTKVKDDIHEETGGENKTNQEAEVPESPTELNIFWDATYAMADRNNTPVIRELETRTNTKITFNEAPTGQGSEKLGIIVASGEWPDLAIAPASTLNTYGTEGVMMPLEDIINNMPNAKGKVTKNVLNMRRASDNNIYCFPLLRHVGTGTFFLREDWLENLDMDVPETLDEYYQLLKAFTENDPDGNGIDDTYGTGLGEDLRWFYTIIGPFGVPYGEWMLDDNGDLVLSDIQPNMKEAVAFAARLYEEGLMDPEFATSKQQVIDEKITNGKYGMITTYPSYIGRYEEAMKTSVPDARFRAYTVPIAPGVSKGYAAAQNYIEENSTLALATYGLGIFTGTDKLDEITTFVDYFFTDESSILLTFGVEGVHHTIENGKPIYKPEYAGTANMTARYQQGMWEVYNMAGYIEQKENGGWAQSWTPEEIEVEEESARNAFRRIVTFSTQTGELVSSDIGKAKVEYFTKIIMGVLPLEEGWSQWLNEFDRLGGATWTKEMNQVYEKMK